MIHSAKTLSIQSIMNWEGGEKMEMALWIITICEIIRILQNSLQLSQLFVSKKMQKEINNEFVKSLNKDNKTFVKELLETIREQEKAE